MKKKILILILPLALICSCKTAKKSASDTPVPSDVVMDESFRKPVSDKDLYAATTEVVPLDTVYIASDTLNIVTKKIIGCDPKNFKLMWNGDWGQSIPAQTGVKLFQYVDAGCTERHKFHLTYNLSPLRLKSDTSSVKSILIRIGGWGKMTKYIHN